MPKTLALKPLSPKPLSPKTLSPKPRGRKARRSVCPVACALDVLGDRWTLLVIRDLLLRGPSRFKDLIASPEKIPTNILSERLVRLVEHGVIRPAPGGERDPRAGYELTPKGKALAPVLTKLRDWGLAWEPGTRAEMEGKSGNTGNKRTPA